MVEAPSISTRRASAAARRARLPELASMFEECRRLSDDKLLLIPGEEANLYLGPRKPGRNPGHWLEMFPKPVFYTMKRAPGRPFVEADPKYGTSDWDRGWFKADDGTRDSYMTAHSYSMLAAQSKADGGGPHLLHFGTGGAPIAFNAVRMDVTKRGRDSYDELPFPLSQRDGHAESLGRAGFVGQQVVVGGEGRMGDRTPGGATPDERAGRRAWPGPRQCLPRRRRQPASADPVRRQQARRP